MEDLATRTAALAADPEIDDSESAVSASLQHALDLAFRSLGHRDRTVAEMRRHLEHKRVEPSVIDAVLAELERMGYLDDARFARRFAEDRRTLDAWGADRIERRLVAVGVAPQHVAAALAAQDAGAELDAAVEVLRRRLREAPDGPRERDRALGLLVRRGYDLELAHDAIRVFEREG